MLVSVLVVITKQARDEISNEGRHHIRVLFGKGCNEFHAVSPPGFLIRLFEVVLDVLVWLILVFLFVFFSEGDVGLNQVLEHLQHIFRKGLSIFLVLTHVVQVLYGVLN